jgi:hypothetical protein
MWPASAINASEPATTPPTTSATMKPPVSTMAQKTFLSLSAVARW